MVLQPENNDAQLKEEVAIYKQLLIEFMKKDELEKIKNANPDIKSGDDIDLEVYAKLRNIDIPLEDAITISRKNRKPPSTGDITKKSNISPKDKYASMTSDEFLKEMDRIIKG